jgi:hypothetical protein
MPSNSAGNAASASRARSFFASVLNFLRVRLELDPQATELLEGVPEEQVLRLHVCAGAPGRRVQPRVPDLEPPVLGRERHVARRADHLALAEHGKRLPVADRAQRVRDPGLHVPGHHPAPDALVCSRRAQALDVLGAKRFKPHDLPFQPDGETFEHN